MVTARSREQHGEQHVMTAPVRSCVYCRREIVWMITRYDGRPFCFNAEPVPRELDDGTGWVPGTFRVRGVNRVVLAPLSSHPEEKRRRVKHVMHLHSCTGRQKQQVAV